MWLSTSRLAERSFLSLQRKYVKKEHETSCRDVQSKARDGTMSAEEQGVQAICGKFLACVLSRLLRFQSS